MRHSKLRLWESAFLLAFALTLTAGVWASASQASLAGRVVRLHVVANSDSEEDQALKLQVRDAVLACATPLLAGTDNRQQAEEILTGHLEELARAGAQALAQAGRSEPVAVSLSRQWFPTRQYDGFSLPAGNYQALRVVIGTGAGQNWWCVVFPPLCLASVTEEADEDAMPGFEDSQVALVTGQEGGYVLKFKVIEWWEGLLRGLGLS